MNQTIYTDPIINRYISLIKLKLGEGFFKGIYQGDPILVPASMLPCLIIAKAETRAGYLSNAEDEHAQRLLLTVITDIRQEISDEKAIVPGTAQLYNIIEGRDPDTLQLRADSLLYVLRHNILVDAALNLRTDMSTVTRVDYGMTIGKRAKEAWSVEGQIEIVCTFNQIR